MQGEAFADTHLLASCSMSSTLLSAWSPHMSASSVPLSSTASKKAVGYCGIILQNNQSVTLVHMHV